MALDILIVDDEADIRELVAGILQDEGYVTRTARDSDDALNQVATRRPNQTRRTCRPLPVVSPWITFQALIIRLPSRVNTPFGVNSLRC